MSQRHGGRAAPPQSPAVELLDLCCSIIRCASRAENRARRASAPSFDARDDALGQARAIEALYRSAETGRSEPL